MKFTSIRVVGSSVVDLPKQDIDPLNPFLLKGADGLGPTPANVAIKKTRLGGSYQNISPDLREISLSIGLNPDWSVGQTADDLREILYQLMAPEDGQFLKIQLVNGETVVAETTGLVENIEPVLFSKDPQVLVTIPCMDAYFKAPLDVVQSPDLTDTGGSSVFFDVENDGSASSGFWMGFLFTATHSGSFQILNDSSPVKIMSITTGSNWVTGDRLLVDTRPGTRGVWKLPNGSSTPQSVLNSMSSTSPWFTLQKGSNRFTVNSRFWDWYVFGVIHKPAYLGV